MERKPDSPGVSAASTPRPCRAFLSFRRIRAAGHSLASATIGTIRRRGGARWVCRFAGPKLRDRMCFVNLCGVSFQRPTCSSPQAPRYRPRHHRRDQDPCREGSPVALGALGRTRRAAAGAAAVILRPGPLVRAGAEGNHVRLAASHGSFLPHGGRLRQGRCRDMGTGREERRR